MFRKNTASQVVGAQLLNASGNTAFTGAVTCYVTGDGGTQSIGSVGSGVCTHEGNGYHTYTPSQAETNFETVAYTFIGSGASPVTVELYPGLLTSADVDPDFLEFVNTLGSLNISSLASDLAEITSYISDLNGLVNAAQSRVNSPAGPDFRLKVSRSRDGTYTTNKPIRLPPGAVDVAISVDMRPLFGNDLVETVGTPTVSGGSVTSTALGPRDTEAMVQLGGTATAGEERTVTFIVSMANGDAYIVKVDLIAAAS